jgi:sugar diacid utilization regulator/putative methionine-R-sulfoxide reductase with GAF domain
MTAAPARESAATLLRSHPASVYEAALLAAQYLGRAYGGEWSVCLCGADRWICLHGQRSPETSAEAQEGAVVLLGDGPLDPDESAIITGWLRLVAERDRGRSDLEVARAEATSQSEVAHEILTIRDLDQVLLSVVNHTLVLLESDICGVLLRDGDVINMTACVGHRFVETAQLSMARGQGLAGLVFESGTHGQVDSYADDRTISPDFVPLAAQEETRSALAVPLLLRGELIGVLEVWRRRDSVFDDADVRRMLSLGSLASIAIDNARLYDLQSHTLARLSAAHEAMELQVTMLDRTARLQSALLRVVLEGSGLERIMRTVGDELGCAAVFARANGTIEASSGPLSDSDERMLTIGHAANHRPRGAATTPRRRVLDDGRRLWSQPVVVGEQEIGTVNLIGGGEPDEAMSAATSQAAMACALARLEQRAASQARNAAFEQIVWDLVEGPPEHRSAAMSRAAELGLALHGSHRVVQGGFDNLTELARTHGWDTARLDDARRSVLRAVRKSAAASRIRLLSMRGDWIVGVVAGGGLADARETATAILQAAREAVAGVSITWGVSAAHDDPLDLADAYREAVVARDGARRMRPGKFSLYDELGIVRLLLGGGDAGPDLQRFVDDITGPLREYDLKHDGALVQTLRGYFDNDCSQRRAAEALFIHPKTLSYRLTQIAELTGLDLATHADRMRADLALRMLQLTAEPGADDAGHRP